MNRIYQRSKILKYCASCDEKLEVCSREQVSKCLRNSECPHCEATSYHYPYGKEESRHCVRCGAEWPVYK